jgi:hypothetical protein
MELDCVRHVCVSDVGKTTGLIVDDNPGFTIASCIDGPGIVVDGLYLFR